MFGLVLEPGFENLEWEGSEMRDCFYERETEIRDFKGAGFGK